ncbi:MAG: M28 family peptidase [Chthoniobacterales bacterium]
MRSSIMCFRGWLCLAFLLTACGGKGGAPDESSTANLWEEFSGTRALADVQHLVDLGPRPPGTEALEKARGYITQQLEAAGWKVTRQTFTDTTPRGAMTFVNLIATHAPKGGKSLPSFLLCSHYDTKFFENETFVGANDGGSSNGILLELARVLARRGELAAKVELVFFDGEEAYVNFTETDGLYGSRYFAKQLQTEGKAKQFHGGILFDMVGDRDLTITLSPDSPRQLTLDIFAAAQALTLRQHFTFAPNDILDDHAPIHAIGIPTIDLIDFDYPPWHTPADTMDKLSAESLGIVGQVATRYLSEMAFQ